MSKALLLTLLVVLFASCDSTKKIVYMQDVPVNIAEKVPDSKGITIQPKDKLSIIVSSKDPELASMFNLPVASYQMGSVAAETSLSMTAQQKILGYVVDNDGNIDFPVLGTLHVSGLTRKEVSDLVKKQLKSQSYIQDAVVTVEFINLTYSVLGEIKNPGTYSIEGDRITLLDALGRAGDLTIYGRRENILLIREVNGERTNYRIDLTSSQFLDSSIYYLQQNDVIYIEPNAVRAGQSTINDNNVKSVSLWTSIASLIATIGVLVFK